MKMKYRNLIAICMQCSLSGLNFSKRLRFLVTIGLLFFSVSLYAQKNSGEKSFEGVLVKYEVYKESGTDKKDKLVIQFSVVNENEYDVYYFVDESKLPEERTKLKSILGELSSEPSVAAFAILQVRNSKGLFKGGIVEAVGEPTGLYNADGEALYVIRSGSTYGSEARLKMEVDAEPEVTLSPNKKLKKISEAYKLED